MVSLAGLGLLLVLTALFRCWMFPDVFVAGRTFFTDPDCYSRMTRVQRIVEHPGSVIHRHEFENWPEGIQPHTTAPFDDLTAALSVGMRLFSPDPVNLAGAWISVLLGVAMAAFLWVWMGSMGLGYRVPAGLLFAVSPILTHGTALGRPDHQSLVLLCLAVALAAEGRLLFGASGSDRDASRSRRGWGIAAGAGWGMGLWVSLYEPGILLLAALGVILLLRPRSLWARERWPGWGVFFAILLLATAVDGWHSPIPGPVVIRFFPNWARSLGELQPVPPFSSTFLRWSLALLPLSPFLLAATAWKKRGEGRGRCAGFWLALLAALFALTCWQARWGYFFALVFVLSLPLQLAAFSKRWVALALFAVSLLPVAREWEERLGWSEAGKVQLAARLEHRKENLALYDAAMRLRALAAPDPRRQEPGLRIATLAPWWLSPALVYWSGQPSVGGSSHQSLPGTVDTARFYTTADWEEAKAILLRRRVGAVLAYQPERVLENSVALLGLSGPLPEGVMAARLYQQPHSPPPGLKLFTMNLVFRVFLFPDGVEPLQTHAEPGKRNR